MKKTLLAGVAALGLALALAAPASAQFAGFGDFGTIAGGSANAGGYQGGNTVNNGFGTTNATVGSTHAGKSNSAYDAGASTKPSGGIAAGSTGSTKNTSDVRDYAGYGNGGRSYSTDAKNGVAGDAGAYSALNGFGAAAAVKGDAASQTSVQGKVGSYQFGGLEGTKNATSATYSAQASSNYDTGFSTGAGAVNGAGAGSSGSTSATFNGTTTVVGNGSGGFSSSGFTNAAGNANAGYNATTITPGL